MIGTGPAGITLAHELGARGRSVLLLEAGPGQYDSASQAEFAAEVVGPFQFPLDAMRLRYLGGCSNHWGGFCQPLDAIDFETKIADVDTAWPIRRSDLDPYLGRAEQILELPPAPPERAFGDALRHMTMRYSPPVNFAHKYGEALARAATVSMVLNARVSHLEEQGGRIIGAQVRDPDGTRHQVQAQRFALCAGGIENSRLLLWSNEQQGQRIVKNPGTLGRYWFEHPHFTIGEAILDEGAPFRFDQWNIAWVSPTEQTMRQQGLLNVGLRITRRSREASRQIIADLACAAPELGQWAMQKLNRRLFCGAMLRASWEQAPRPWNRVVLAQERDRDGIPRAELHWRLSDLDRRTVLSSATLFAETMVRLGLGRVRLDPWVLNGGLFPTDDEIKGNHHMGGTRMSADPRTGIVDAQCRVHGLSNLYIGGSSVFPSGGAANPTLTIVQLALRLADQLAAPTPAAARLDSAQPPSPS